MTTLQVVKTRQAVRGCENCTNTRGPLNMPMEIAHPSAEVKVAFIVQPPSDNELRRQRFLKDQNMQYLTALVNHIFSPEEVAWIPVAGCRGSISSCRTHLEAQLYALDSLEGVVLVGGDAIDAWRPDQYLTNCAGKLFMMLNRWWCVPIDHPDSIISYNKGKKQEYQDTLTMVHEMAINDIWPEGDSCRMVECPVRRCGFGAVWWDRDEVGYCERHKGKHGGQWQKQRKVWDQWKKGSNQLNLLDPL